MQDEEEAPCVHRSKDMLFQMSWCGIGSVDHTVRGALYAFGRLNGEECQRKDVMEGEPAESLQPPPALLRNNSSPIFYQ